MSKFDPLMPHTYPRRVLLAVTGLSPQILTETLYALAVSQKPAFVPTEIHLITTAEGADRAQLSLLHESSGWFHRLCHDYDLKDICFNNSNLHILKDVGNQALSDIRTLADNEHAADMITETVRQLTEDPDSAVHVSIAGGRKTMGFYVGYALSLYGRPQDRLSHVLVNSPYENHPDFYYPSKASHVIYTPGPERKPLDTQKAEVTLAQIPFVRLRHGLPDELLSGLARFSETVAAVQRTVGPRELVIDIHQSRIRAGGIVIELRRADLAFYSWFAQQRIEGKPGVICPFEGSPESSHADSYLSAYRQISDEFRDDERTAKALASGMDKDFFHERKSRLHKALKTALRQESTYFQIVGTGRRPMRYALTLPPESIRFGAVNNE